MKKRVFLTAAIALAVALLGSYPAVAQMGMQQAPQQQMYKPPPAGFVRIGVLNNDGSIDRYAWVDARELDRAIERSREGHMAPTRYRAETYAGAAGRPDMREEARIGETHTVTGALMDLNQVDLAGLNQRHEIARVKTPEGRVARVDLGPVGDVQALELNNGDQVTVYGHSGTINDVEMLMANRIEAKGRTIMVSQPYDRDMREYTGQVIAVRVAPFAGARVSDQVFARVQLSPAPNSTTAVDLGPADQFRDIDLNGLNGKMIGFLAHPAKIGDRVALVADEVRVDGRTIPIHWNMASATPPYGTMK